jgi:hypothetical protein
VNPAARCRNCEEPLTGEYCARCGQRERGRDLRLTDLAGEAFEDLAQVDGRVWRTLISLLFRPGRVTADYLAGKRVHYLPPLRLYLVVSFIVFLIMSLGPVEIRVANPRIDDSALDELQPGVYVPVTGETGETELVTIQEYLQSLVEAGEGAPAWLTSLLERIASNAAILEEDPSTFLSQLMNRLPQVMFMLLPLFALLLKMAYLLSPFHYLQHLIFSLHYHTTAFLYLCLLWPVRWLMPGDYGGVVLLAMFIYLPIAMVRVYGSSKPGAVVKSFAVGISYYLLASLVGAVFVLVNLAML